MDYFDDEKNVTKYIEMAAGYDGGELIDILQKYLPPGSSVLEIGMGPGKDLELLGKTYKVTGSDSSQIFLDLYCKNHASADLIRLDARTLKTDRRFDCIYSNKVLHHLSDKELLHSLKRQSQLLNPSGILFHSFWYGDSEEFMHGLRFRYYSQEILLQMVKPYFDVLEADRYTEIDPYDSLYLVLKKRGK